MRKNPVISLENPVSLRTNVGRLEFLNLNEKLFCGNQAQGQLTDRDAINALVLLDVSEQSQPVDDCNLCEQCQMEDSEIQGLKNQLTN